MATIRDLYENGNFIEPSNHEDHIAFWNHYYRDARHPDGKVDCKLVKIGMLGSCWSFLYSDSDSSCGSESDSFSHSVLSGNKKIMTIFDLE